MARARAVVSAIPADLAEVERLVRSGRYASTSDFVRQAVAEKLARERAAALAEQVEEYVRVGHADGDADLLDAQAFEGKRSPVRPARRRRAKR